MNCFLRLRNDDLLDNFFDRGMVFVIPGVGDIKDDA